MDYTIEEMTHETVSAVAQIEQACFTAPWSYGAFLNELNNPMSVTYVAVSEGTVIGFLNAAFVLDEGSVNNVAVLPAYRGHGVGQALLAQTIACCRKREIASLTLEVRKSNAPAIRLYRKLGFLPVGERRNFYTQPTEDALLLTKKIIGENPNENTSD